MKPSFTDYAFPSNHTMFYIGVYFDDPSLLNIFLAILGTLSRIFYEYHTFHEVDETLVISILIRLFLNFYFVNAFIFEIKIIEKAIKIISNYINK